MDGEKKIVDLALDLPKSIKEKNDSSSDDIAKLKKLQTDNENSSTEDKKMIETKKVKGSANDKCSIVIKNIDKNVTDNDIRNFLKGCGRIKNIVMPKNKKGLFLNFAYVEFYSVTDVGTALSLNGASLNNKKVFVFRKKAISRKR